MGTIYRKFCPSCDLGTEPIVTFDGFAGAAIMERSKAGEIVCGSFLAFLNATGELVPLRHPCEDMDLEEQGISWSDATWNGRLILVTNLICQDCGMMSTTAEFSASHVGCLTGMCLAIISAVALPYFDMPILVVGLAIWLSLFMPNLFVAMYLRMRFKKQIQKFQLAECICGSKNLTPIAAVGKKKLPCTRCSNMTLQIEIAGRA